MYAPIASLDPPRGRLIHPLGELADTLDATFIQ